MARRKREPEIARIGSVTHDGRGIVAGDGKKVFVAGALAGELVSYRRRKSRRNFDEAELLEVIEPAPGRVEPRCAAYGRCGGCSLQHVSVEEQRAIKSRTLRDNLSRIGRVEPERWLEPLVGDPWNYRRRARLAVKDVAGKGRVLVGFRERHAPYITDMRRCEVLEEPLDAMIEPLSALIGSLSIRARLPQIEVAVGDDSIALVFRVLDPPGEADRAAVVAFAKAHGLTVYLQPGGPDSVEALYTGTAELGYSLQDFGIELDFGPLDFVQVNAAVNRRMVGLAVAELAPEAGDRVLDLYCGIGNFSLPLARRAAEVLGIEGEGSLVARAAANAARNGIANARFECADLAAIDGSEWWCKTAWDLVLLDPARSGAAEPVARMAALSPRRIVYVSCHPGTLARDAGMLVGAQGFRLEAAGIIDMFPHTAHVESIAVFSRAR